MYWRPVRLCTYAHRKGWMGMDGWIGRGDCEMDVPSRSARASAWLVPICTILVSASIMTNNSRQGSTANCWERSGCQLYQDARAFQHETSDQMRR